MFGFFTTLFGLGFVPPTVSDSIFPLYIQDLQTGVFYYFDAPLKYVDREKEANRAIPRGVVEDILEEPDEFRKNKLYAISGQRVRADGTLFIAPDGAEVAPTDGAVYANSMPAL
jgi:hypothetical protein